MEKRKYFDFHAPVFIPSAVVVILFVAVTLIVGKPIENLFAEMQSGLYNNAGWFLILTMNILLVSAVIIAWSPLGKIRLGGEKATPEFSNFSWYSMLFAAGMGIGLVYFGVAEPVQHFIEPPTPVDGEIAAAEQAFQYTFLHYGFHPWGVYGMVALALAFFTFNRHLPLAVRSLFSPLLGRRVEGVFGNTVDTLAVVACLFGLATTLGFGAQQLSSGLHFLFGIEDSLSNQVTIIILVTLAATVSVVLGVDKGVRKLSEFTLWVAGIFLISMLLLGPTVFLLESFIDNVGLYLQNFLHLSTYTEAYADTEWQNNWTIFYYAWWISWSPFVGIFIARVSKGRTVREFITYVVLLPSIVSFFWFSVFGGSAIYLEMNNIAPIGAAVAENISTALFAMLGSYPVGTLMSFAGVVLIIGFFVTSSDSGSLVVDSLTSGGKLDAPVGQRIFWALAEGALAATLLIGGGLVALQTAVMLASLPFAITLILMVWSLVKGLQREKLRNYRRRVKRIKQRRQIAWTDHYEQFVDEEDDDEEDDDEHETEDQEAVEDDSPSSRS